MIEWDIARDLNYISHGVAEYEDKIPWQRLHTLLSEGFVKIKPAISGSSNCKRLVLAITDAGRAALVAADAATSN